MLNRFVLTILLACVLATGCKQSTDSSTDNGTNNTPAEITLLEQTDLPQTGGSVSSIIRSADGKTVAIVDGRLMNVDVTTNTLTQIGTDTTNLSAVFVSNSQILVNTESGIRKYELPGGVSTTVTLPIQTNREAQLSSFGGVLFVVNSDGFNRSSIYRSIDDGATWTKLVAPTSSSKCYLAHTSASTIYCASADGVYRSTDAGASWSLRTITPISFVDTRVFVTSTGDVYYWAPKIQQMQVSHAGGAFVTIPIPNALPAPLEMTEGAGGVVYLTGQDVQTAQAIVPSGVMRSTDGGSTWTLVLHSTSQAVAADGNTVLVGTQNDGGIIVTTDGTNWRTIGRSRIPEIFDFAYDKNDDLIVSGGRSAYRKTANGWATLGEFTGTPTLVANANGAIVLAGVSTGYLVSSDNGQHWTDAKMPTLASSQWGTSIMFLFARSNNDIILGLGQYNTNLSTWVNGGLYVSQDGGQTFSRLVQGTNFTRMVEDPTSKYLYAHTENFAEEIRSTDGGATWATYGWNFTPFGFTNSGKAIITGSTGFRVSPISPLNLTDLKVKNLATGFFPRRISFGTDNKMRILTTTQLDGFRHLYVSEAAVQ